MARCLCAWAWAMRRACGSIRGGAYRISSQGRPFPFSGRSRATRPLFESKGTDAAGPDRCAEQARWDRASPRCSVAGRTCRQTGRTAASARSEWLRDDSEALPLQQMNTEERLVADYAGTGLTVGKHPMHYRRAELRRRNVLSAEELRTARTETSCVPLAASLPASGPAQQRLHLPFHGRRNRHRQCHRHARSL